MRWLLHMHAYADVESTEQLTPLMHLVEHSSIPSFIGLEFRRRERIPL